MAHMRMRYYNVCQIVTNIWFDLCFKKIGILALLTDDELCDLQEVTYAPRIPTGPGLPTKSPLRELIKIGIRKIYETGLLAHNWNIWMSHLPLMLMWCQSTLFIFHQHCMH